MSLPPARTHTQSLALHPPVCEEGGALCPCAAPALPASLQQKLDAAAGLRSPHRPVLATRRVRGQAQAEQVEEGKMPCPGAPPSSKQQRQEQEPASATPCSSKASLYGVLGVSIKVCLEEGRACCQGAKRPTLKSAVGGVCVCIAIERHNALPLPLPEPAGIRRRNQALIPAASTGEWPAVAFERRGRRGSRAGLRGRGVRTALT